MLRHELLGHLHRLLEPRSYLEIGVSDGRSLTLSRTQTVAIDPAFKVTSEVQCDLHLVRATSDEFFARTNPLAHFRRPVVDLAFIDGMHLSEYTLRDFMNVERYTTPASVIVFDDMLPRTVDEAARDRITKMWTGDVYKVMQALQKHRPDLLAFNVDTQPTGTSVVLVPDATAPGLTEKYDDLVEEMVVDDPQDVPTEVLERKHAVDPEKLVASPAWERLAQLRNRLRPTNASQVRSLFRATGLTELVGG
ncbi:MAG: class I SAM-dependent methyltransferase [Streptosporangiales bacterium]|nr:class I SAM-dependent methyltransferase [Streptosporangiales bacterium]MBO0890378.1 class I SAM-dependent methyltransferase [Acidothermales bacterium]